MALRDDVPALIDQYNAHKATFSHNAELFDIFEGNLLGHILRDLQATMSAETFKEVSTRVAPINVLKRLVEKLSKIYAKPPQRAIVDGGEADDKLLADYVQAMDMNTEMGSSAGANGFFNLFKNVWIEPYLDEDTRAPKLRVIPSDRFFVYSVDTVNPTKPTHLVKIMGKYKTHAGVERTLFYAYTSEEFLIFNDEKEVLEDRMAATETVDGKNPLGALPGIYINRSRHNLMPQIDSDTLSMTKLIPILLSDLNYALKYQTFGAIYSIDCEIPKSVWAPNMVLNLKSDGNGDKPGTIGTIKPEVDSDKALTMIKALFSLWMETRAIKAGSMGTLTTESAASGIAKAIDEMDTSEDRQNQVPYFAAAEAQLWALIMTKYHPMWLNELGFKFKGLTFSSNAKVSVTFAEQRPNLDPTVAVDTQIKKLDAGLQTKEGAIRELYPDWSDKQVKEKLAALIQEQAERHARQQEMLATQKPDETLEPGSEPKGVNPFAKRNAASAVPASE